MCFRMWLILTQGQMTNRSSAIRKDDSQSVNTRTPVNDEFPPNPALLGRERDVSARFEDPNLWRALSGERASLRGAGGRTSPTVTRGGTRSSRRAWHVTDLNARWLMRTFRPNRADANPATWLAYCVQVNSVHPLGDGPAHWLDPSAPSFFTFLLVSHVAREIFFFFSSFFYFFFPLTVTRGQSVSMQMRSQQLWKLKTLRPFWAAQRKVAYCWQREGNVINSKSCKSALGGEAALPISVFFFVFF